MKRNMDEGFIKDFIKGFKDGYKSVINKYKSKDLIITDTILHSSVGSVEYVLITVDNDGKQLGESDLLFTISAVDAEKYPIMAWSKDDWQTFEVIDPSTLKTLETVKTGKHTGPGFNFTTELANIAKVLNKYNLKENQKEVAGMLIFGVVNKILEGADIRQSIYEAYKTQKPWNEPGYIDKERERDKDEREDKFKRSNEVTFDSVTLFSDGQVKTYKKYIEYLNRDNYVSWWLQGGDYYDWKDNSVKLADDLSQEFGVRPVLHITNAAGFTPGQMFYVGGKDPKENTFIMLPDNLAIAYKAKGTCAYRKGVETTNATRQYNSSDIKKFVDSWFTKVKK